VPLYAVDGPSRREAQAGWHPADGYSPGAVAPGLTRPLARANRFDLNLQLHILLEAELVTVADTEVAAVEHA
jgi:hypothetical protein